MYYTKNKKFVNLYDLYDATCHRKDKKIQFQRERWQIAEPQPVRRGKRKNSHKLIMIEFHKIDEAIDQYPLNDKGRLKDPSKYRRHQRPLPMPQIL